MAGRMAVNRPMIICNNLLIYPHLSQPTLNELKAIILQDILSSIITIWVFPDDGEVIASTSDPPADIAASSASL